MIPKPIENVDFWLVSGRVLTHRNIIFSSGKRFSYLEAESRLPDYWSTLFVTVELRSKLSQNTILSILGALRHLKLWKDTNQRDLIAEFGAGKFVA
ncbi:hypothetical protein AN476_12325 [Phaeobacter sp. 11ANDIMAR09]|nr:hypothetical protein AN476_12325 [Phaeobacter sp. 11ANDIMAR09]